MRKTNALLSVKETAEALRLDPSTVRRLLRRGTLPGIKCGQRCWRIPRRLLEQELRRRSPRYARVV
jgi:excisionase family DNA binding protein